MSLYRLIYVSTATVPIDLELLASIMSDSEVHNKDMDLTGMLLTTDKHFLQVLEGSMESVNKVYQNINRDDRHENIILIAYNPINERLFKNWSMKAVSLHDVGKGLTQLLKEKYGVEKGDFKFPTDPCRAYSLFFDVMHYLEN